MKIRNEEERIYRIEKDMERRRHMEDREGNIPMEEERQDIRENKNIIKIKNTIYIY